MSRRQSSSSSLAADQRNLYDPVVSDINSNSNCNNNGNNNGNNNSQGIDNNSSSGGSNIQIVDDRHSTSVSRCLDRLDHNIHISAQHQQSHLLEQPQSLPIEISFLVRQQAQSLARINRLERKIVELRNELNNNTNHLLDQNNLVSYQHNHHPHALQYDMHHAADDLNGPSVARCWNTLNRNNLPSLVNQDPYRRSLPVFSARRNHRGGTMFDSTMSQSHVSHRLHVPTPTHAMNKGPQTHRTDHLRRSFFMSDDSGGDYSRATLSSDNDELSSVLDHILKISPTLPAANGHHTMSAEPSQSPVHHHHHQFRINESNDVDQFLPDDQTIIDVDHKADIHRRKASDACKFDPIEHDNWLRFQRL